MQFHKYFHFLLAASIVGTLTPVYNRYSICWCGFYSIKLTYSLAVCCDIVTHSEVELLLQLHTCGLPSIKVSVRTHC